MAPNVGPMSGRIIKFEEVNLKQTLETERDTSNIFWTLCSREVGSTSYLLIHDEDQGIAKRKLPSVCSDRE